MFPLSPLKKRYLSAAVPPILGMVPITVYP